MRNHKKKIDSRARRLQKARGEGQEWRNVREERARARGARAQGWGHDAGRVGAGGCSRRGGRRGQRGELHDGGSPQRGDPTAVPPRGVEPRTLPTIRPTGRPGQRLFSSVESQTTCSDVVGQVDFQLQSAACSCCSTPASASRRTNLSMVPVKPMVPKKSTPPVQKVETWATFEPRSPPEENLRLIRCKHKYRSSMVHSRICTRSRANLATCPKSEHGIRAGAAHAAWICMQPHVAPQGWVNLAAAG